MKNSKIIICDIDGTVADLSHRLEGMEQGLKNYFNEEQFQFACVKDKPIKWVVDMLNRLVESGAYEVKFVSSRPIYIKYPTLNFLKELCWWVKKEDIYLATDPNQSDEEFKLETIRKIEDKFADSDIAFILEDKAKNIDLLRDNGYNVMSPFRNVY